MIQQKLLDELATKIMASNDGRDEEYAYDLARKWMAGSTHKINLHPVHPSWGDEIAALVRGARLALGLPL